MTEAPTGAGGRWPLALHTWTLDTTPLATAISAARLGGFDALELRRIDFKRGCEDGLSNREVLDVVRAGGLPVATLGTEYGWIFATGAESLRLFAVLHETCANAVSLGCPLVMSAPGPVTGTIADAIRNARTAADIVAGYGLRLSLEFNSQHEVINSLEVLGEIVEGADRPNLGLLLDSYHLARSGRPGRGFAEIDGRRLFAFQYSDVAPTPVVGVKRPTDRLPPGEGTVRWAELLQLLDEKGFRGPLSYEAPNPALWAQSPYRVCKEGAAAMRRLMDAGRKADPPA